MVTTLQLDDEDSFNLHKAIRERHEPHVYGKVKEEVKRMVKNHTALLESEAKSKIEVKS